ncbi:MAG: Trm112 family protein [Pseudomonadales bacterium]
MDPRLLEFLVCPVTKGALILHRESDELWCRASGLAYPIRDGVPVMLQDEARHLTDDERDSLRS